VVTGLGVRCSRACLLSGHPGSRDDVTTRDTPGGAQLVLEQRQPTRLAIRPFTAHLRVIRGPTHGNSPTTRNGGGPGPRARTGRVRPGTSGRAHRGPGPPEVPRSPPWHLAHRGGSAGSRPHGTDRTPANAPGGPRSPGTTGLLSSSGRNVKRGAPRPTAPLRAAVDPRRPRSARAREGRRLRRRHPEGRGQPLRPQE
jgi:hypothetical protein